jgi:hypothetical protein
MLAQCILNAIAQYHRPSQDDYPVWGAAGCVVGRWMGTIDIRARSRAATGDSA